MPESSRAQLELKRFLLHVGLILLFGAGMIFPLAWEINQLADKLQDQKSEIMALANREKNIAQLQANYLKIKNDIPIVTAVLPDEENVASLVEYLENLASREGVNLEIAFDAKANDKVNANKYLMVSLSISGGGQNVGQYFQSLETGPYFISAQNFDLSTNSGLDSDSKLKLTVKVFTNDPYKINK